MKEQHSAPTGLTAEEQKAAQLKALIRRHLTLTLRRLRAEQNVSQQEAADFLKISRSTYVYYETGRIIPDIAKLCQLSSLFQVSVLEFFPSVPEN